MTVIASILFLLAFAGAIFTIAHSISQSMPRIIEVIEHRAETERMPRKIIVGALRQTAKQIAPLAQPRLRTAKLATSRLVTARQVPPRCPVSLAA